MFQNQGQLVSNIELKIRSFEIYNIYLYVFIKLLLCINRFFCVIFQLFKCQLGVGVV